MNKFLAPSFLILGMVAGATLFSGPSDTASAQGQPQSPKPFRECYFMKIWSANGGQVAKKLAGIPSGWTVAGGGSGGAGYGVPGVVLCR